MKDQEITKPQNKASTTAVTAKALVRIKDLRLAAATLARSRVMESTGVALDS